MNNLKRYKLNEDLEEIDSLINRIELVLFDVNDVLDVEEDDYYRMSPDLQMSTDGTKMEMGIENLQEACDALENALGELKLCKENILKAME